MHKMQPIYGTKEDEAMQQITTTFRILEDHAVFEEAGDIALDVINTYWILQGLSPLAAAMQVTEVLTDLADNKGIIKATDLMQYLKDHKEIIMTILDKRGGLLA